MVVRSAKPGRGPRPCCRGTPSAQWSFSTRASSTIEIAGGLTPPLVLGNLISYRGFKEMLFVGGSSDVVYSIDAVLNRVLWTRRFRSRQRLRRRAIPECASGLMGIVMTGSAAGGLTGAHHSASRRASAWRVAGGGNGEEPVGRRAGEWLRTQWLVVSVGSDGNVYPLYQSNGALFGSPIKFLPPTPACAD